MPRENHSHMLDYLVWHKLMPDAPVLVDVGCCIGWFSQDFLERFPAASVLGIDLDKRVAPYFLSSCLVAGQRAQFLPLGVSDFDGTADFWTVPIKGPSELTTLVDRNAEFPGVLSWDNAGQIDIHRLDSLITRADYVKIDAELVDLKVIRGMERLLKDKVPTAVQFELFSQTIGYDEKDPRSILDLFEPYGYTLMVPVEVKDGDKLLTDLKPYHELGHWGVNNMALRNDALEKATHDGFTSGYDIQEAAAIREHPAPAEPPHKARRIGRGG